MVWSNRRTSALVRVALIGTLSMPCATVALRAQAPVASAPQELSLVLQPEAEGEGVPHRFTVVITNVTSLDLRVPEPRIGCNTGSPNGTLFLEEAWLPPTGMGLAKGSASCCSGGTTIPQPPLVEQARHWHLLRPHESMTVELAASGYAKPGIYLVSVSYGAPALYEEGRQALQAAQVFVPKGHYVSENLTYRIP